MRELSTLKVLTVGLVINEILWTRFYIDNDELSSYSEWYPHCKQCTDKVTAHN